MNKLKNIQKKVKQKFVILFSLLLAIGPLFALVGSPQKAEAADADSSGMVYLQILLEPSTHHVRAVFNGAATGNKWFAQNTKKSPEYISEGMVWGKDSWANTENMINNQTPIKFTGKTGSLFSAEKGGKDFKKEVDKRKYTGSVEAKNGQTALLSMSYPGWGAGDTIPDLSTGNTKKFDRTKIEDERFTRIDNQVAGSAASAVNESVVADLNRALDTFYSKVVDEDGNGNPDLNTPGMSNMLMLVAQGYLPKNKHSKITYNTKTYTFDTSELERGKLVNESKPKNKTKAGAPISKIKSPDSADEGSKGKFSDNQTYTYAAAKGYSFTNNAGDDLYATDLYAITWMDIALSAIGNAYIGENNSTSDESSNSVIADQVDSYLYNALAAVLSALGVKEADQLVFGPDGSLFKNGTWEIYLALMFPFFILALIILSLVVVDSWRKVNLEYLTTGQVRSIQSSLNKVVNTIIMVPITIFAVMTLVFFDQILIGIIKNLNTVLSGLVGTNVEKASGFMGFLQNMKNAFVNGTLNIVLSILLGWVNIKFTWRYIARTISFGMYYISSPLVYALDALKQDNAELFRWGPMTADVMKNLTGLILQRSVDALGIVIAINLGRVIFGQGLLITIIGYLSIEAVTDAVMSLMGVRSASIKGIADQGKNLHEKIIKGAGVAAVAMGAQPIASAAASIKSGKALDHKEFLANEDLKENGPSMLSKMDGTAKFKGGTGGQGKTKTESDFDLEAPVTSTGTILNSEEVEKSGGGINPMSPKGILSGDNDRDFAYYQKGEKKTFKINEGGVRENQSGLFRQGLTNAGVAYDRNSRDNKGGVIDSNKSLNPNMFTINKKGQVVGKGLKGKAYSGMRGIARGAGGAVNAFKPGTALKTGIGAGFLGLAETTPTKLDNIIGYSVISNNLQNATTGGNRGMMAGVASSWAGRMLGVNPGVFEFDEVNANGSGNKRSVMREKSPGQIGDSAKPVGIQTSSYEDGSGGRRSIAVYDQPKDKELSGVVSSMSNFAEEFGDNNSYDSGTQLHNFSRQDIYEKLVDNNTGTINQDAQNLLNHMDVNSFDKVSYDPKSKQMGLEGQLEQRTMPESQIAKGTISHSALTQAKNSGTPITDQVSNVTYDYKPGSRSDNGTLTQFTPAAKQENKRINNVIQNQAKDIMQDKNLSQTAKVEAVNSLYQKPNDLEFAKEQSTMRSGGVDTLSREGLNNVKKEMNRETVEDRIDEQPTDGPPMISPDAFPDGISPDEFEKSK